MKLMFGEEIQKAIMDMVLSMLSAVPKFITAIVIFIIGLFIANMIKKFLILFLSKAGVDKFADKINEVDFLKEKNITIKLTEILAKLCYYLIMLIFLMAAVGALDMPILAELIQSFIVYIPNLIAAFFIIILGLLAADGAKNALTSTCKSLGMPSANMIGNLVFYFIIINVIIVALTQSKINTDFFAQNLSIIIGGVVLAFSIGYGFASKDLVASFLASQYTKDKLNIGSKITVNGVSGVIVDIDKSSVSIDTGSSKIIMPLNKILHDNLEIHY